MQELAKLKKDSNAWKIVKNTNAKSNIAMIRSIMNDIYLFKFYLHILLINLLKFINIYMFIFTL